MQVIPLSIHLCFHFKQQFLNFAFSHNCGCYHANFVDIDWLCNGQQQVLSFTFG